ncbi:MAG: DUF1150 family protein [Amylibacter sp.]|nr:DUF1150 family protein [Amylibacter sp.]|tara:strand:- start:561 stop:785 length:225 start_codon:yes stop_codon:yes gene_type:complete
MTPLYEKMGLPSNIVYIRSISHDELPVEVLDSIDKNMPLFAVYAENGQQIALVEDQQVAFALAQEHKFSLHSVH